LTQETTESRRTARERRQGDHGYRASRRSSGSAVSRPWPKIAAAVVVVVLVLAVAVDAFASAGRVHPGVTVAGVRVGRMTPSEATAALEKQLPAKSEATVTVVYGKKTWKVAPADIALSFDYPKLTAQAMAVGREGGFMRSVSRRFAAWFGKEHLPAPGIADPEKMKKTLDAVAETTDVPALDATVEVKGTSAEVKPSLDGVELKRAELSKAILAAYTTDNRTIQASVQTARPKISNSAAEAAKGIAIKMMSSPVAVTYSGEKWTFSPTDIGKMITFQSVEPTGAAARTGFKAWKLVPSVDETQAAKNIAPKLGAIGTPARDAQFKTSNGSVTIIPSKDGSGPDLVLLASDITTVLKGGADSTRTVEIKTTVVTPKLTTTKAREMGVTERISTFTTTYDGSNEPRTNNIHTLGAALDGKLVAPGATFSFNGAVGERTAAKGYLEAPAIVKGKLVPQLGGGICQVGTTLFNTAFFAGVPIPDRTNHSFYIAHYPTGRDATVSWGGPDLKWRNDTKNWILVSVSYTSDSITISFYGTKPGYDIQYTTGPFTNETPYPTEKVKDPTLATGAKVVKDPGITGRKCVVTRTVTKSGQVVRRDTFASDYKPKVEVVRIGTKGSKPATATVTPKP
jgi:vancomycin resistance protein YoaR